MSTAAGNSLFRPPEGWLPGFCEIVNGRGARATEACGRCGRAAEEEVRRTGKPYVYRCRFGFWCIAVPVPCNGAAAAMVPIGPVLGEPHSREGFERIAASVRELPGIDLAALEAAYRQAPGVSAAETTGILEAFAACLAGSSARLARTVREQCVLRTEFAWRALAGSGDGSAPRETMRRLGLTRVPCRVLIVRPDPALDGTAAVEAVEEVCGKRGNAVAVYLARREICVFFDDRGRGRAGAGEIGARRFAARILEAAGERVRIGIGTARPGWGSLAESHREALLALAESAERIAWYRRPARHSGELSQGAAQLAAAIADRNFERAEAAARELSRAARRRLADNVCAQRVFFRSSMDAALSAAGELGLEAGVLAGLRAASARDIDGARGIAELHEAFARCAAAVIGELRRLYSNRAARTVERVSRIIDRALEAREAVTMGGVASELGISQSHLSRTFHRATGLTFERYLAGKRVEMARRLLLDPLAPISGVAEACGFTDANYFARVFRKLCGCSPREYRENPERRSIRTSSVAAL